MFYTKNLAPGGAKSVTLDEAPGKFTVFSRFSGSEVLGDSRTAGENESLCALQEAAGIEATHSNPPERGSPVRNYRFLAGAFS